MISEAKRYYDVTLEQEKFTLISLESTDSHADYFSRDFVWFWVVLFRHFVSIRFFIYLFVLLFLKGCID